jgi:hypothetical protein
MGAQAICMDGQMDKHDEANRRENVNIPKKEKIYTTEICALLGYYVALCGNCLPEFWDSYNYHMMPHNIPEERRSHQHRSGSLKSRYLHN